MLIKVFGVWLMASAINTLVPQGEYCGIRFNYSSGGGYGWQQLIQDKTCDEVAEAINAQIKADREGK